MTTSLRAVAASCLGISGSFSLSKDFFGYRHVRPGPVSLRRQLELLRRPHIHLDVIIVGPGLFAPTRLEWIDHALYGARQIFEEIPLGIARVAYHEIPDEHAGAYEVITRKRQAKQLTRRYRGSNDDAMDLFFVPKYAVVKGDRVLGGICNNAGCNKDLYAFNGCVIGADEPIDEVRIRRLTAHELGHGLRLAHRDDDANLMQGGGYGTSLTGQQKRRMLRDCFVQDGCGDA